MSDPLQREVDCLKALAEPTRLRLAVLLAAAEEVCVCALAEALGEPEYKISRHLRVLRAAGLVEARREGTWMHYRIAEGAGTFETCVLACLQDALHTAEDLHEARAVLDTVNCDACPTTQTGTTQTRGERQ